MKFSSIHKTSIYQFTRLYILYAFISYVLYIELTAGIGGGGLTSTFFMVVGWTPYVLLLAIIFGIEAFKKKIHKSNLYISIPTIGLILVLLTQITTFFFGPMNCIGLLGSPDITLYEVIFSEMSAKELCSYYGTYIPGTSIGKENPFIDIGKLLILVYLATLYITTIAIISTAKPSTQKMFSPK